MATLTETPRSLQETRRMPTFHASLTFAGSDTIVADEIVITGRFRDHNELRDWIEAGTNKLMSDIEKERSENNGH